MRLALSVNYGRRLIWKMRMTFCKSFEEMYDVIAGSLNCLWMDWDGYVDDGLVGIFVIDENKD